LLHTPQTAQLIFNIDPSKILTSLYRRTASRDDFRRDIASPYPDAAVTGVLHF
jgi:hypothetical protein